MTALPGYPPPTAAPFPSTAAWHGAARCELSPLARNARAERHGPLRRDVALARRAALRDPDAWRELHAMASELVAGTAWRYGLGDACEDLLQDVMERLVRKISTYRGDAPLRAWVASICYNRLRNAHRAARTERRVVSGASQELPEPHEPESPARTDERAIGSSERVLLEAAMTGLGEGPREVVRLRVIGELSVEETASRLGVREGTVKSRLSRALVELRLFVLVLRGAPLAEAARASRMTHGAARRRVRAVLPAWRLRLPRPLVASIERRTTGVLDERAAG
jgi:RNA polymerase sigma-70 factor (ECF subfamily)